MLLSPYSILVSLISFYADIGIRPEFLSREPQGDKSNRYATVRKAVNIKRKWLYMN
jgi:hypothetical protein